MTFKLYLPTISSRLLATPVPLRYIAIFIFDIHFTNCNPV